MINIILVGEFNSITQNLYQFMKKDYDIQLGSSDPACLKGILEIAQAQLLLVVVTGLEKERGTLFELIEKTKPGLPVICIGTEKEIAQFPQIAARSEITVIHRPVQIKTIRETITKLLGVAAGDATGTEPKQADMAEKRVIQKILLVDDSQIQLRVLTNLLQKDYNVCTASSGTEALKLLPQFRPDLIFLDYSMPGLDGRQTLQKIRENGYGDIPVVFLTGVKERSMIRSVLELNPAGYLLKPVEQNRLFEILEELSVLKDSGE